jgi:uroporphyrin-III C-methyltransferase/precorrin-2 dehydrogenase/sirohydrochlorin ferrochelatase
MRTEATRLEQKGNNILNWMNLIATGPARIAPLARLPLFHGLHHRKAVVVGTSAAVEWKAELLRAAGADVVRLPGEWTASDLAGAALAVADLVDADAALRFVEDAHRHGAIVNVIDRPELCDVHFGTLVNRSPLVIGISTDGAAPMLGQSIRARIESILPLGIGHWVEAAKTWRLRVKRQLPSGPARRRAWERFVDVAWRNAGVAPSPQALDRLLDAAPAPGGRVTLVGAGPGDPELLTLKALQALQGATVILHDHLVGAEILEFARREAKRIAVGKAGGRPSCSQSDINGLMVQLARAGESVVRLKGGDPLIFGRATDEIAACRAAGIEVSVIPGISAAQGAAASLLVSLTERRHARRVQFVTGHAADGKLPTDIDWRAIADAKCTTVLYMPRATLSEFVANAVAKGLDPRTPAVAIAAATLPEQVQVAGPVVQIATLALQLPRAAPLTIIIGWVARDLSRASEPVRERRLALNPSVQSPELALP